MSIVRSKIAEAVAAQKQEVAALTKSLQEGQAYLAGLEALLVNGNGKGSVSAARPVGRPAASPAAGSASWKEKGLSKAESIRRYHADHPEATTAEVASALKTTYANVYQTLKNSKGSKSGSKKRGSKKGSKVDKSSRKRDSRGLRKVLIDIFNNAGIGQQLKLQQVMQGIIDANYESGSSKSDAFSGVVQTTISKLVKQGVLVRDKENHTVSLAQAAA